MNKPKFLIGWSVVVGAMDAFTGLLLVVTPAATLRLLGLTPPGAEALVFLSWIGVFVAAVGLSYAMVLIHRRWGTPVWIFTALVRSLVVVFVICQIATGNFAIQWLTVALADLVVAAVQLAVLQAGWWEEGRR